MTSLQMLGLSGFSDSCTGSIFILDMQRAVCIKQARRHKILQSAMRGKREREREMVKECSISCEYENSKRMWTSIVALPPQNS